MSDATKAVFLSYASQDADAARRIAAALRAVGVEVWFDQSELTGGDAWDAKIKRQIQSCALFVPVISQHTQEREEGYFRLEWKLAEDRSHLMAKGKPFIVPVSVDGTTERGALVPEAFTAVQWTRLPGGEATPAFVVRMQKLLGGPSVTISAATHVASQPSPMPPTANSGLPLWVAAVLGAALLAVIAYVVVRPSAKESASAPKSTSETRPAPPVTAIPLAPDKSIAVLPFVNMSAEKESEFFADGMHDEVITALAKIHDLKVISRTSVMAYRQTEGRNLKKIAAELGVANVLEGSVQRAGNKVKVIVQLIDARTDQHLWAETYIEDLTDVFTIQAKLTGAITTALKATLSPEEKSLIARRPTQNVAAYEFYLRAMMADENITSRSGLAEFEPVVALYQQAIAKDPGFALVYARLTRVHGLMYFMGSVDPSPARRELALAAISVAERLAPDAPETHMARGAVAFYCDNDFTRALSEYRQAEAALPNDDLLQQVIGATHRRLGHWQEAVNHYEHTMTLSPHNFRVATQLATFLRDLRRYDQARDLSQRCLELAPRDSMALENLDRAQFAIDGDLATYLYAFETRPLAGTDPTGLRAAYRRAMLAHDYMAAEQALADPRLKDLEPQDGSASAAVEPVALHRALVAFLMNRRELTRQFAEEAIVDYQQRSWTPRQQFYVALGIALAKALAGRGDEAMREGEAAANQAVKADPYTGHTCVFNLGLIYLVLDRRDEALATLKRFVEGPTLVTISEIRVDPLWSRLKDDPRFEEILKSAKPL